MKGIETDFGRIFTSLPDLRLTEDKKQRIISLAVQGALFPPESINNRNATINAISLGHIALTLSKRLTGPLRINLEELTDSFDECSLSQTI